MARLGFSWSRTAHRTCSDLLLHQFGLVHRHSAPNSAPRFRERGLWSAYLEFF